MNPNKLARLHQKHPRVSIETLRGIRLFPSPLWPMTQGSKDCGHPAWVRQKLATGTILKSRDGISEYAVEENGSLTLLRKASS